MKKKLLFFIIVVLIAYILFSPVEATEAASLGLILWFERILPALLPFAILSNILIYSNCLSYITKILSPVIRLLLPVSEEGSFVVISGFLFGFPIGSKNCAELLRLERISFKEAEILFIITNNISPVFIGSYILSKELGRPELFFFSLLILYLPALFLGEYLLFRNKNKITLQKKSASRSKMNFQIIDAGIMNGFETLTRIGGYIILFSIFTSMLKQLPLPELLKTILIGITEITNGIHYLASTPLSIESQYVLAMAFTAFGGISGMAQTSSMVKDTDLSMKKYIGYKFLLAFLSAGLAFLLTRFW